MGEGVWWNATMQALLGRLLGELGAVLRDLDSQQTQERTSGRPSAWTVQQIVEHLRLTYAATDRAMRERIAKGSPTKTNPSPAQWMGQMAVTRFGYFPKGRMAPSGVTPTQMMEPLSGEDLRSLVARDLEHMDAVLAEAELMLGRGRSVSHIILGPMSIDQWRRFHLEHGRHHVKQITAITKASARSSV